MVPRRGVARGRPGSPLRFPVLFGLTSRFVDLGTVARLGSGYPVFGPASSSKFNGASIAATAFAQGVLLRLSLHLMVPVFSLSGAASATLEN